MLAALAATTAGCNVGYGGDQSMTRDIGRDGAFRDEDGDGVAELQEDHADFQGGDARNIRAVTTASIPNSFVFADRYASLQAAHDAVTDDGSGQTIAEESLIIPPGMGVINETLNVTKTGLRLDLPGGTYPHIQGSGDHAVDVSVEDVTVTGGWIDQTDSSGAYDGIHITGAEAQLTDIDVDFAPRYGVYTNGTRTETRGLQVLGGETAGVYIGSGAEFSSLDAIISVPSDGVVVDANYNRLSVSIKNAGGRSVVLNGGANVVDIVEHGSVGDSLVIDGQHNVVTGRMSGNVTLTSNSSDNRVAGYVGGAISDNGTGNDTTDAL